jgi:hypothetical protein
VREGEDEKSLCTGLFNYTRAQMWYVLKKKSQLTRHQPSQMRKKEETFPPEGQPEKATDHHANRKNDRSNCADGEEFDDPRDCKTPMEDPLEQAEGGKCKGGSFSSSGSSSSKHATGKKKSKECSTAANEADDASKKRVIHTKEKRATAGAHDDGVLVLQDTKADDKGPTIVLSNQDCAPCTQKGRIAERESLPDSKGAVSCDDVANDNCKQGKASAINTNNKKRRAPREPSPGDSKRARTLGKGPAALPSAGAGTGSFGGSAPVPAAAGFGSGSGSSTRTLFKKINSCVLDVIIPSIKNQSSKPPSKTQFAVTESDSLRRIVCDIMRKCPKMVASPDRQELLVRLLEIMDEEDNKNKAAA